MDLPHVEPHEAVLNADIFLNFGVSTVKGQPNAVVKWYHFAVDGEFHITQTILSKFQKRTFRTPGTSPNVIIPCLYSTILYERSYVYRSVLVLVI